MMAIMKTPSLLYSVAVAEILKGNPKYMGASITQGHAHLSSGCSSMVGLGKPKLYTNFDVASPSCCRNIIGEPQILRSSPSPGLHPLFFWWDLMMGLGKPQLHVKFEVTGFIYYGNIREFDAVFQQLLMLNTKCSNLKSNFDHHDWSICRT